MQKKVWKDEKKVVKYDKYSNTPVLNELPELHGVDENNGNKRNSIIY